MAGIGGKGVLLAGQMLAAAGIEKYRHVVWTPTYAAAMRSGACECTVILSDAKIASPILTKSDVVIVFESSQLADFEVRTKPGGILIAESAQLPEVKRQEIKLVKVPATEIAAEMGSTQVSNFILLGVYLELTGALPPLLIEREIEQKFAGNWQVASLNKAAFNRGRELIAKG